MRPVLRTGPVWFTGWIRLRGTRRARRHWRRSARAGAIPAPRKPPRQVQGLCPAILPIVRLGLPDSGYPDPACRTGRYRASRTAAGPRIAWPTGKGPSVSAGHHAALGGFAGLTIFLGLPLGRILVVTASVALAA